MRLFRYFATIATLVTALVLTTLVVLVVAVTLVESVGDLTAADTSSTAALWLALYSAVQYGYQVLPIACFVGALVAGTTLAHNGELLAAQAAGMSPLRLASSFFAVAVGAALLGGLAGETIVPKAIASLVRVQREDLQRTSALTRFYDRRSTWFRQGNLLLYLPEVDPDTLVFSHPVVYRFEDGLVAEVMEAQALRHDGRVWWLDRATIRKASDATALTLDLVQLELRVKPTDLVDITGDPRQLTAPDVAELARRRRKAGFDATAHTIELHNRFAMPLSGVWMFLLVAPWALHPARRRSLAQSLGAGVVVIAVLLSVTHTFRLLALGHKIPPALGAWGASLFALALLPLSFWLYHRYRVRGSVF